MLGPPDSMPSGEAARPPEGRQALECQSVNHVYVETPPWRPELPGLQVGVLTLLGCQALLGVVVG